MTARDGVTSSTDVQVRPLSSALGAEVIGIDANTASDAEVDRVRDIWHEYQVVLLRDQHLGEDEQASFGRRFGGGSLSGGHNKVFEGDNEGVVYVTNVVDEGAPVGILPDGEMQFHSDQCHQEMPSKGTMLYAIEVSTVGGDTRFANAYRAYETLSDEMKARIADLKAVNIYDYAANPTQRGQPREGVPSHTHPVVRTHPVTGRKALFVNRLMTARIEGMDPDEGEALLTTLFDHQEQPQFIYDHKWQPGDMLIWDNRCVLHARTDFDPGQRRRLRRVTLPGEAVI